MASVWRKIRRGRQSVSPEEEGWGLWREGGDSGMGVGEGGGVAGNSVLAGWPSVCAGVGFDSVAPDVSLLLPPYFPG